MAKHGALPVYLQISELLIREIDAGHLLDGERFAPERAMAQDMGISVGTLRKALADLENKGLLERRHGSGNYVQASSTNESVYAFFRLELTKGGGLPSAEIVDVARLAKPDDLPEFGKSTEAIRIRRVRSLNTKPVALEEIWLDGALVGTVSPDELSESLYLFYKKNLGIWVTRVEDRIGLAPLPDWTPSEFHKTAKSPSGFVERISWAQNDATIEFSRTWFDTDLARYVSRLR